MCLFINNLKGENMKNLLIDNLIKDLSEISSKHDHCLDEIIKLYIMDEIEYVNIEPTIKKTVTFEKKHDNTTIEITDDEMNDLFFKEEFDNQVEIQGTINGLLIEAIQDIEI